MTDARPSSVGTFHPSRRTYRFTVLLFVERNRVSVLRHHACDGFRSGVCHRYPGPPS